MLTLKLMVSIIETIGFNLRINKMQHTNTTPVKLDVQQAYDKAFPRENSDDIVMAHLMSQLLEKPYFIELMKDIIDDTFSDYLYQKDKISRLPKDVEKLQKELQAEVADSFFTSVYDEILEIYNKCAYDEVEALREEDRYSATFPRRESLGM